MGAKKYTQLILKELLNNSDYINDEQVSDLADLIEKSNHIFLACACRSGVVITGLTNCLIHLGIFVILVDDLTRPNNQKGDLLILDHVQRETEILVILPKKPKKHEVKLETIPK